MILSCGSDILQFYTEKRFALCLLLFVLELFIEGAETATRAEIENHLELGKNLLARGQLSDALTHYHAAVEGNPTNYLTYFKRGTVYLALGKARSAINDFTKALELNPDFTTARIQRGSLYMNIGDFDKAEIDFMKVLEEDPFNADISLQRSRLGPARNQWQIVQEFIESSNYKNAIPLLTQLLEISPRSVEFRKARAECYIKDGDILSAISDLHSVNKLSQDNPEGYYRLAVLLYQIGHATNSLKEIRVCLKLHPEHKECFPFFKKVKKIEKALTQAETYRDSNQYADCIASANSVLNNEKDNNFIIFNAKQLLCTCYNKDEQYTEAIKVCGEAIRIKREPDILCDRAEAFIGSEIYDEAILDYKSAIELDEFSERAKEGLKKANKLQKQAEKRDYYKILNVKRTATKKEIVKAYRKAAQKWHPDNYQGDEKKIAEKKFIDVAAAKEVLTDPEKRRRFDMGDDPLDPESGNNNGNNPFQHFQHFQHGSPFQFKFHFN